MSETTNQADLAIDAHYSYKEKQSKNTAREYRRHIRRFHSYLDKNTTVTLWNAHSGHAEEFYQWMLNEKGYAPSSIRVAHAALGDFYKQMMKFGSKGYRGFPQVSIERDPTEHATPERLNGMHNNSKKEIEGGDKPLSKDEVVNLVANVPSPTIRNELICRMLYQTGIRRSELVRIKLDHIDRNKREITIYGKKTEESRTVWYQPSLDTLLNLWIDSDRNAVLTSEESPYLFCTLKSEMMDEQTVTDVVTEAAEQSDLQETVYENRLGQKIRRVGAHTLRKSFGVHFINDGGDISFLMELLGHSSIETTKNNYLKYSKKDLENSIRRHGPSIKA